jgi:hypothetical protein
VCALPILGAIPLLVRLIHVEDELGGRVETVPAVPPVP